MNFLEIYGAMQYAAGIALVMVGLLQFQRWLRATPTMLINRRIILPTSILVLIIGIKQLFWSVYGTAMAANLITEYPQSPVIAAVFNALIVFTCVWIFLTASPADRVNYGLIGGAVCALTLGTFLVGGL